MNFFSKNFFLRTSALTSYTLYLSIAGAKVALYFYSPNIFRTFLQLFFSDITHTPHYQRVTRN